MTSAIDPLYLDTSLLVALLTAEPRTTDVALWMSEQEPEPFAISNWVVTEFSAALSIKLRMGRMREGEQEKSLGAFARLARESFLLLGLNEQDFMQPDLRIDTLPVSAPATLSTLPSRWRTERYSAPLIGVWRQRDGRSA